MVQEKENNDHPSDEISIKDIVIKIQNEFSFLCSKWKIILLAGLFGTGIGFCYAYIQKPIYSAILTYALEDERNGASISGALGIASSFGFDLGTSAGGAFGASNLMELLHSRSLIEKALLSEMIEDGRKKSLADYYIEIEKLRKAWIKKPELIQLHFPIGGIRTSFTRLQDSILGRIYTNIDENQLTITQKDRKVSITTIEVKSHDEIFAKLFCEALVKEVSDYYIESKSIKAKTNVAILQKQSDSVRSELNAAISGVAIANDNTYNLNPGLNIKKIPSVRRQVDVQANTAILTEIVKNLELAKVTLRKETPLIQVIDRPVLPLKKEVLSKKKGAIVGGIIFAFLTVLILGSLRWWRGVMSNDRTQ